MKIAIDLDEVLADTLVSLIDYHNRIFNTDLQKSHFNSYEWWRVWGGTREDSIAKFFEFVRSEDFHKIPRVEGAKEAIEKLNKDHSLIVVTSRQSELEPQTHKWLELNFGDVFDDVYVINHPQWATSGPTLTKSQVCLDIGADVLIEDSLEYAHECKSISLPVILFDYPWNQGELPDNAVRVKTWDEVVLNIEKLEGKNEF